MKKAVLIWDKKVIWEPKKSAEGFFKIIILFIYSFFNVESFKDNTAIDIIQLVLQLITFILNVKSIWQEKFITIHSLSYFFRPCGVGKGHLALQVHCIIIFTMRIQTIFANDVLFNTNETLKASSHVYWYLCSWTWKYAVAHGVEIFTQVEMHAATMTLGQSQR